MADRYTADLFDWLNQVKADAALPASAFKVAFEFGQFVNRDAYTKDGVLRAWPSLMTVAKGIGMGERSVREMAQRLASAGHVKVTPRRGPSNPNRYELVIRNRQEPAALNRRPTAAINRQSSAALMRQSSVSQCGSPPPINYLKEPSEESSDCISVSPADAGVDLFGGQNGSAGEGRQLASKRIASEAFEGWWKVYPRKVGKDAAAAAYSKAIRERHVSVGQLLDGAERYAAERASQDPKFTKHPATWLRAGCWADEPEPLAASAFPQRGSPLTSNLRRFAERIDNE